MLRGGVAYSYVKDHLGSVRLVVDSASGAVLQRIDYDAWGMVIQDTAPGAQPFSYVAGIKDADTAFDHFGFRDYDAAAGVWTAQDPIRLRVGGGYLSPEPYLQRPGYVASMAQQGVSVPTYAYANNNPITNSDPTGLNSVIFLPPVYPVLPPDASEWQNFLCTLAPGLCDYEPATTPGTCPIPGKMWRKKKPKANCEEMLEADSEVCRGMQGDAARGAAAGPPLPSDMRPCVVCPPEACPHS